MSNQSNRPRKHKGLRGGIISFGITFALFSVVFHGFTFGRIILGLILAGLVGTIIRVMGSGLDLTTHNKQDKEPETLQKMAQNTGNPEVDALLQKGREMLAELRVERRAMTDKGLADKLLQLENQCAGIFRAVYDKPAKASQIRKFMDYYLPTTLKMARAYRTLGERNVYGKEAAQARGRIDDALGVVLKGCQKLLDNLYRDDVLDITTDIDVLEQMLKRDGLTESALELAARQAKQAAQIDRRVEEAARERAQAGQQAPGVAAPQAAPTPKKPAAKKANTAADVAALLAAAEAAVARTQPRAPAPPAPDAPAAPSVKPRSRVDFTPLFQRYVAARQALGEDVTKLRYERFEEAVRRQAEEIRKRTGSSRLVFEVQTAEGRVKLVGRPVPAPGSKG